MLFKLNLLLFDQSPKRRPGWVIDTEKHKVHEVTGTILKFGQNAKNKTKQKTISVGISSWQQIFKYDRLSASSQK